MPTSPFQLILFFCACGVRQVTSTVNLADVACGQSAVSSFRIKNGDEVIPGEFPWIVALYFSDVKRNLTYYICGGTIIHKRFILTAAHCVNSTEAEDIKVAAGEHLLSHKSGKEEWLQVERIIPHPQYTTDRLQIYNDIALLQMGEDVNWTHSIHPVCLPDKKDNAPMDDDDDSDDTPEMDGDNAHVMQDALVGSKVTVAGWGLTDEYKNGGRPANALQKVELEVVSLIKCENWHQQELGIPYTLKETQLCAGFEKGKKDACKGDSGGPLLFQDEDDQQVLLGVISSGFGCGRYRLPGVYTRVSRYMTWITDTINYSGFYLALQDI